MALPALSSIADGRSIPARRLGWLFLVLGMLAGCVADTGVSYTGDGPFARHYTGIAELSALARSGDILAEHDLGMFQMLGIKTEKNPVEGMRWLRMAAEAGNADAAFFLGVYYQQGALGRPDLDEARKWYRKSAEQGYAPGQAAYGHLFDEGAGVPVDYAEALTWFRLSAAQNNPLGQNNLGTLYDKGRGVSQDPAEAARLYRLAASQGMAEAQLNLGYLYENGRGVPTDRIVAYALYDLAVTRLSGAHRDAGIAQRDRLTKSLSSAEVTQGQQLAGSWRLGADTWRLATDLQRFAGDTVQTASAGTVDPRPIAPGPVSAVPKTVAPGATEGRPATGPRSIGTGFAVGTNGQIVSNAHVIAGCGHVRVRQPGMGTNVAASVTATNTADDLALLTATVPGLHALGFRAGSPRQGEGVMGYGFPLGPLLANDGAVTMGSITALAGIQNDPRMLQLNAPVQPGNSGGPLVDLSGNVVGVISAKLNAAAIMRVSGALPENVNFAIKNTVVESFLQAHAVSFATAAQGPDLKPADLTERIRQSTVLVECWR
ncbi:MAG TPA: tetratricopeptide repeat-containing serine protease family protein [Stellaceae bacterium]|nr:tetratricopeptide repeat-containing serine protease family protein [Stellaceae bacterium]